MADNNVSPEALRRAEEIVRSWRTRIFAWAGADQGSADTNVLFGEYEAAAVKAIAGALPQWQPIAEAAKSGQEIWAWGPQIGCDKLVWEGSSKRQIGGSPCHWYSEREDGYIPDCAVTMYVPLPERPK